MNRTVVNALLLCSVPIQRVTNDNIALCEALNVE